MKLWLLTALILAASPVSALAAPAHCLQDQAIDAGTRRQLERSATAYAEALIKGDASTMRAAMTVAGRAVTEDALVVSLGSFLTAFTPGPRKVARTLLVENPDDQTGDVACGDPVRRDTPLQLLSGAPRQATVEVVIPALNNDFDLVVFFIPEDGGWKVHGFYLGGSKASGKSVFDILDMARAEDRRGHVFNASILLLTAAGMIDRGPILHFAGAAAIKEEISGFAAAPELVGAPPFDWDLGGCHWLVVNVGALAVAGEFTLMIEWAPERWDGSIAADQANRVLLEAFMKARPEWQSVFTAVFVKATSPAGRTASGGPSYTTGYIVGEGISEPPTED